MFTSTSTQSWRRQTAEDAARSSTRMAVLDAPLLSLVFFFCSLFLLMTPRTTKLFLVRSQFLVSKSSQNDISTHQTCNSTIWCLNSFTDHVRRYPGQKLCIYAMCVSGSHYQSAGGQEWIRVIPFYYLRGRVFFSREYDWKHGRSPQSIHCLQGLAISHFQVIRAIAADHVKRIWADTGQLIIIGPAA